MDRIISPEERPGFYKRYRWVFLALLLVSAISLFLGLRKSRFTIPQDRVRMVEVRQDLFEDVISFQARVEPEVSFSLDAVEGGTVQEIFAEAGQTVKAGQPLLRLVNTSLMLDFMNRETQIIEQINNLRNTRMQLELNERQLQEQVLDLRYEQELMGRQYAIDTLLFLDSVIAPQAFADSRARYRYLVEKRSLLEANFTVNKAYRQKQLQALDQSIEMMERNLKAIRENLENLVVRAPIDGQLTNFLPEVGQSIARGENIGRIEDLSSYLLRAQIDEHYLARVAVNQKAFYEDQNHRWNLAVHKVYPQVQNSQFRVEFKYLDTIPPSLRSGQGLNLRLALSASANAIIVPRGAFFSSTGGRWVFVVDDAGNAYRREVKLGRQNPDYLEVISGLEPGERIISSSYESFKEFEQVELTPTENE